MKRSIELFSGAGGLAIGVARAGFEHAAVVDLDNDACSSLRANFPDWPVYQADVRELDFREHAGRINLLAAGVPCQPFSLGGKHRGNADSRDMFPELIRAVRETAPEIVLVENVKGLLRTTFREYFNYILSHLSRPTITRRDKEGWRDHKRRLTDAKGGDLRYEVEHQLINCADYGIPQIRWRVFVVAFRSDLGVRWLPLRPTHSEVALLHEKWVTGQYWREHGLRRPAPGADALRRTRSLSLPLFGARWRTVRDALIELPDPESNGAKPGDHALNPGARAYPGHTGSPYDLPAKTLKAGDHGCPGGENMLRRDDGTVRYFTVREAARLQTFPDSFRFQGAWSECLRQIGNAVPVEIGFLVARAAWAIRCGSARVSPEDTIGPTHSP